MRISKTLALTILMLTFSGILNAQNSDFINWETTAKDASGQLIINQTINVQIALYFGTTSTMASYIEKSYANYRWKWKISNSGWEYQWQDYLQI